MDIVDTQMLASNKIRHKSAKAACGSARQVRHPLIDDAMENFIPIPCFPDQASVSPLLFAITIGMPMHCYR